MPSWPDEKMRRWVTLYADAGWKEGRAKCGFIARGSVAPTWLRNSSGATVDSSLAAEGLAVLFGLREVHRAFGPNMELPLEGLFVRSDCLTVVRSLEGHWNAKQRKRTLARSHGDFLRILEGIFEFCDAYNIRLDAKHVKAHGRERDRVRQWMNDQADTLGNMRGVQVTPTRRNP